MRHHPRARAAIKHHPTRDGRPGRSAEFAFAVSRARPASRAAPAHAALTRRSRRAAGGGINSGGTGLPPAAKRMTGRPWAGAASPPERVQCWSGYGPAASSSGEALPLDPSERPPALAAYRVAPLLWA